MGVDGLADVDRVAAHFNGQRNFADQIPCMRADDAAADDAMRSFIEYEFGKSFVAPRWR